MLVVFPDRKKRKHKRRTHHATDNFSSNKLNNDSSPKNSINNESIYEIQPIASELYATTTNLPSAITIADLDTDEMTIRFRRDANKPIVFSVTCLERYQLDTVDEFLRQYSSRVTQTASINSEVTHLIKNDDKPTLHSPLSMKLIEAIANHCAYEIEGDDTDCHFQGGPKRSRSIDKRLSLFEYICFIIKCTENNDIKMTNVRLQDNNFKKKQRSNNKENMTTTASTSSNLPDKDQIRAHVRRDGLIERQRFNTRICRPLCKYSDGEECKVFVAYRSLCVGHYHQTSDITVNELKRRQLIQQSATAVASSKATMIPSKIRCSIETPLTLGLKHWRRKTAQPNSSTSVKKQSSQISSKTLVNNNSNKCRKSDEWVLLKRCRYDSTQNIPSVQSILLNTSTTIDESTAAFDSNQACSSVSSIDSHADDYILAQKSISITPSHLTDEQMIRIIGKKRKTNYYYCFNQDHLDQFLQRFNIHYSDKIDEKKQHI
ncbi:unnamed protein product [Rotaria sp. Silwood2]|nr:unnamed protein product [Rotaria sp. Silwood2]